MIGEDFGALENLEGIKIAEVVSNEDPKLQGRLLIRILGTHNLANKSLDNAIWANHCAPTRDGGVDAEPGDFVYGVFMNKRDPMHFIWFGFVRSSFQFNDDRFLQFDPPVEPNSVVGIGNPIV